MPSYSRSVLQDLKLQACDLTKQRSFETCYSCDEGCQSKLEQVSEDESSAATTPGHCDTR